MHDKRRPPSPPTTPPGSTALVPLRGPSGKLYGMLDPQKLTIAFIAGRGGQHKERQEEVVDIRPYLAGPPLADA